MEYTVPEINDREAAVLGLLCENPLYGYTIEKIIERAWDEALDRYRVFLYLLCIKTAREPELDCKFLPSTGR